MLLARRGPGGLTIRRGDFELLLSSARGVVRCYMPGCRANNLLDYSLNEVNPTSD